MSTHMPDGDDEAAVAVDAILLGLELRISDGRLSSTFSAYHALHSVFSQFSVRHIHLVQSGIIQG